MQLYETLVKYVVNISVRTVLQTRQQLGWTYHGSAYCQLIREANQVKRLEWARTYINDDFENVIYGPMRGLCSSRRTVKSATGN